MSNKELKSLRELAESLENEITAEGALNLLVSAGILNTEGEHTDNFESLDEIVESPEVNVQHQE